MTNLKTARCPVATKQAQAIIPTTRVFDSLYEVFVLICFPCFSPNVVLCFMAKHYLFDFSVPEIWQFVHMQFLQSKLCFHVVLERNVLLLQPVI